MRRAAHQLQDQPKVLDDPLAIAVLGPGASERVLREFKRIDLLSRSRRAFIVAHSRYAEDQQVRAVERGVRQYVILGAGLDTFGYQNRYAELGFRVLEVDHPLTQVEARIAGGQLNPDTRFPDIRPSGFRTSGAT